MRAAVTALSWELVARYRLVSLLSAGWAVLACALGLLLSRIGLDPLVGVSLMVSLAGPAVFLIGGIAHGFDARLESSGSCFPPRLFTLPVSSAVLVGPPLLLGTLLLFLCWFASVLCLLRPFGLADVPLVWPALCSAACFAWIQAFTWIPFPIRFVRLVCCTVFLFGVLVGTSALIHYELSESLLSCLYLTLLLLAYAAALAGVTSARRGVGTIERFPIEVVGLGWTAPALPPFSSPLRAQLWLEWKVHGWVFVLAALLALGVALPSMCFMDRALNLSVAHLFPTFQQLRGSFGDTWLEMSYMLFGPFLVALSGGSELGKAGMSISDRRYPPFLATRPMSIAEMMQAKLIVSVFGVLFSWVIMLAGVLLWTAAMGRFGDLTDHLVAWTGSGAGALAVLVGGQLMLLVITWLWLVGTLWAEALGRQSVAPVMVILGIAVLCLGGWLATIWRAAWWPILDVAIVVCLAGKLFAVGWVVRQLSHKRLVQPPTVVVAVIAWVLFAGLVVTLVLFLTSGQARWAGVAILMLPLACPLACPLALARNRTR
jgi:hypothetical protein